MKPRLNVETSVVSDWVDRSSGHPDAANRQWRAAIVMLAMFFSSGCIYSLPPVSPPGEFRLRLVAPAPERYAFHVEFRESKEYRVPADGRLTIDTPAFRRGCAVSLFGVIPLSHGHDPMSENNIQLSIAGKPVRRFSFHQLANLPKDPEGYRVLKPK
jgi:hypothetical protein